MASRMLGAAAAIDFLPMNPDKTILTVLVTLIILYAIFFVIQLILARGRNRAQPVIRRAWLTDVIYWFTTVMLQMCEPFAWNLRFGRKVDLA
jgi:hypothetical protein